MNFKRRYFLKKITAMRIGGPAKYFVVVKSESELQKAIEFARSKKIEWYVVGDGSNLVVSDKGFPGLIIQNHMDKFTRSSKFVSVGAGRNLLRFIQQLNSLGLAGLEKMAGIPGTLGGAIYGCAGAYGQEIKDHLISVRFYDGRRFRSLRKSQCKFGYRNSIFKKHNNWIITEATFALRGGERRKLRSVSQEIIKSREMKYSPGLYCPGSFFKNIKLADLRPAVRQRLLKLVSKDKINFGKIPAGYLLERVGSKGMKEGHIQVSVNHGNLIFNAGAGTSSNVYRLARRLKRLVKNKFGVTIEEEVQYLSR